MLNQLIALLFVVALHSSIANAAEELDIPFYAGENKIIKDGIFDTRYSTINNRLKDAPSDEPFDVVEFAKEWNYDFGESKKNKLYSEGEWKVKKSLDSFIKLDKVVEDLENKQCTSRSQLILEKNFRHTSGLASKSNLKNDRYAGTVRKLIQQRAELCQDYYVENTGSQNVIHLLDADHYEGISNIYVEMVDKLISNLKEKNKFVPYVIPKEVGDNLGEAMYYAIIAMAKKSNDKRGEELEALTVARDQLWRLVEDYIIDSSRTVGWLGEYSFTSAALDKKVLGKDVQLSWEKNDLFVRRLEAFLFKYYIDSRQKDLTHILKEFLRTHEGGKYTKILYAHN